jgi:hypothetical protein
MEAPRVPKRMEAPRILNHPAILSSPVTGKLTRSEVEASLASEISKYSLQYCRLA